LADFLLSSSSKSSSVTRSFSFGNSKPEDRKREIEKLEAASWKLETGNWKLSTGY
jgi:hypothetical protein